MFAEVQAQFPFRGCDVALSAEVRVGVFDLRKVVRKVVHGGLLEGIRRLHILLGVRVLQAPVHDLIVLLQHLSESRLVQLDVRAQLANVDVKADRPFLEGDDGVVQHRERHIILVIERQAPPSPSRTSIRGHHS